MYTTLQARRCCGGAQASKHRRRSTPANYRRSSPLQNARRQLTCNLPKLWAVTTMSSVTSTSTAWAVSASTTHSLLRSKAAKAGCPRTRRTNRSPRHHCPGDGRTLTVERCLAEGPQLFHHDITREHRHHLPQPTLPQQLRERTDRRPRHLELLLVLRNRLRGCNEQ